MDLGFAASAWRRAVLGLAVAAGACALLLLVEGGRMRGPAAGGRAPEPPVRAAVLRLESGFPVATWAVSVGGRAVAPGFSDALSWTGPVSAPSGSEVLVEAIAASAVPAGAGPRCALRLVIDGDPQGERSAWGDGGVVATVTVP